MSTHPQRIFVGVAWPYANGSLHLGHLAGAYLPADLFARAMRMERYEVVFVSGSDCHGTPITLRADAEGVSAKEIASRYHAEFLTEWDRLGISFDLYTTTMTDLHTAVVQEEFLLLLDRGFIVEREVATHFDPVARRFLADRYVIGRCAYCDFDGTRGDQCDNCGRPLEADDLLDARSKITGNEVVLEPTAHFFLDLPSLQDQLAAWVGSKTNWRPHVLGETRKFLDEGLRARAITRNLDWGVPIPVEGFGDRRIYVWFEAVTGYLSATMEWAQRSGDPEAWRPFWEDESTRQYYFLGKDNIPFHTLIWPGILLGRGDLGQLPYDVPANCFLNFGGAKASKSGGIGLTLDELGDVVAADALRYALAANLPEFADSNFSLEDLEQRVNGELIGTWGNLVNRVFNLIERRFDGVVPSASITPAVAEELETADLEIRSAYGAVELRRAVRRTMQAAQFTNAFLSDRAPWKDEDDLRVAETLYSALQAVDRVNQWLAPVIPQASAEVHRRLGWAGSVVERGFDDAPVLSGTVLGGGSPLFSKLVVADLEALASR